MENNGQRPGFVGSSGVWTECDLTVGSVVVGKSGVICGLTSWEGADYRRRGQGWLAGEKSERKIGGSQPPTLIISIMIEE